jgi:hypothetical protein
VWAQKGGKEKGIGGRTPRGTGTGGYAEQNLRKCYRLRKKLEGENAEPDAIDAAGAQLRESILRVSAPDPPNPLPARPEPCRLSLTKLRAQWSSRIYTETNASIIISHFTITIIARSVERGKAVKCEMNRGDVCSNKRPTARTEGLGDREDPSPTHSVKKRRNRAKQNDMKNDREGDREDPSPIFAMVKQTVTVPLQLVQLRKIVLFDHL